MKDLHKFPIKKQMADKDNLLSPKICSKCKSSIRGGEFYYDTEPKSGIGIHVKKEECIEEN